MVRVIVILLLSALILVIAWIIYIYAQIKKLKLIWPTKSKRITSYFGNRIDPFTGKLAFHNGIDIAGNEGDEVYSAYDGIVLETGYNDRSGNYVVINHGLWTSHYAHLSEIKVKAGQKVKKGEVIGLIGSTGRVTGPHLHFGIKILERDVNPLDFKYDRV